MKRIVRLLTSLFLVLCYGAALTRPETAQIDITDLPVGPHAANQNGKVPFTLVPLDGEQEYLVEPTRERTIAPTNGRNIQTPSITTTIITPESSNGKKIQGTIAPRDKSLRDSLDVTTGKTTDQNIVTNVNETADKQLIKRSPAANVATQTAAVPLPAPGEATSGTIIAPETKKSSVGPEVGATAAPAGQPTQLIKPVTETGRQTSVTTNMPAPAMATPGTIIAPETETSSTEEASRYKPLRGSLDVSGGGKASKSTREPTKETSMLTDVAAPSGPVKLTATKQAANKTAKKSRWQERRNGGREFSMADIPQNAEEEELIAEAIGADPKAKAEKKEAAQAFEKLTKSDTIHLGQYLEPWKGTDPNEKVEMNFDNKELTELLRFLSNSLDITFILDDAIEPQRAEGLQPLAGTKITFKSHVPLTLKQAWEIGLTFIEMAGFSIIPSTQPRTYRVTVSASKDKPSANREPIPTFIGTDPELLPQNDTKIRYVYFAENAELPTIIQIIEAMKSGSSGPLIEVPPLKAVIITDKAANIKSVMSILQEIDRVSLPETLAIIRLKHTDARQVRELYHRLIGKDPANPMFNPFSRQRKPTTTQYFTEATRVFEEPYSNSLIVLGTRDNIKRFEDFIIKYVDKTLDIPFSPLHIIQLKYIDAASIAKILNEIIQKFNADPANTAAALVGGVRDTNKFFRPTVRITEEASGNRLIINSDYEEYLKIRELIEKLDVEQPQVAIKVLILNVDLTNLTDLGVQLRNRVDCCDRTTGGFDSFLGKNVNFQTSNLGPIVTRQPANASAPAINGSERLLGNLINLANQVSGISPFEAGSTLITLGKDIFGFWGLLRALESYTRISVVANPFLVTTNKYKSEIKIGETRRTTTAIVEGQREAQAQGDISADLRVVITPQISYDDMVTLNIYVELGQFTSPTDQNQNRLIKKISTEALLANREVLALGGLIRDSVIETTTKVPLLGDLPLVGWLFKSKSKTVTRTSLLILISPEIIKPYEPEIAHAFTYSKIADAKDTLYRMRTPAERRDPIHRWLFNDNKDKEASAIDKFVAIQQRYVDESQKKQQGPALKKRRVNETANKGLLDLIDDRATQALVPEPIALEPFAQESPALDSLTTVSAQSSLPVVPDTTPMRTFGGTI